MEPYLGAYDRGDMALDVASKKDELTLTITSRIDRGPELNGRSFPLVLCPEVGVFLFTIPGVPRGLPVVFRHASDGRLYMHAGGRSTPKAGS